MKLFELPGRTAILATMFAGFVWSQTPPAPAHNVILFVADGLRAVSVTPESAPTMARLKKDGVDFVNSHASIPLSPLPMRRPSPPDITSATPATLPTHFISDFRSGRTAARPLLS